MIHFSFPVGVFQCNCHVLVCPQTGAGVIIDPGDEAPKIMQVIEQIESKLGKKVFIQYLFHTHAHFDHIGATRAVKERINDGPVDGPKICLHQGDKTLYKMLPLQGVALLRRYKKPLPVDHYYQHEESFSVGQLNFSVIHTPGHTSGSVCLRLHENSNVACDEMIFSGDTLFKMGVGRTDLPGGSFSALKKSIRQHLFVLDDDTLVHPGHGLKTFIGLEKRSNPFVA